MRARVQADWLAFAEARDRILDGVAILPPERRGLLDARGCVLAEDIHSPVELPRWDNSAMDGFAVRAADIRGASDTQPRELAAIEDVPAGVVPERTVGAGEATRIMTGAPIPEGADTVVRVEHTDGGAAIGMPGARVRIHSDADAGRNIRPAGEDIRAGELVLPRGTVLHPSHLGLAASVGRAQLSVVRRPVVGILASGDELVDTDGFAAVLDGRRIVSSNSYTLAGEVQALGMEARLLGIAADRRDSVREHLEAARGCDALVTSAGISVGEHDYLKEVLLAMGTEVEFWRVRIRPGSPFAFGWFGGRSGIPWFGLPGNPVSTSVTFQLFVAPALLKMAGHRTVHAPTVRARLTEPYRAAPGLTHFPRVELRKQADGSYSATLAGAQGSGLLSSMARADALLVVPPEPGGAAAGEEYPAILLHTPPRPETEPG